MFSWLELAYLVLATAVGLRKLCRVVVTWLHDHYLNAIWICAVVVVLAAATTTAVETFIFVIVAIVVVEEGVDIVIAKGGIPIMGVRLCL